MKKKILSVILAAAVVCSMTGCGGESRKTDGETAQEPGSGAADDGADAADDETDAAISDTVLWFNGTWAVLNRLNQFDYETYPGLEINKMNTALEQESLKQSWDEFYESYFAGYEYWSEESSDERRAIYDEINGEAHSPFQLDWDLTFEKTW